MAKYREFFDGGASLELLPESVPHLLHQDLAYLWLLEEQADLRSRGWSDRLVAWRELVSMLLAGELTIEEQEIGTPFLSRAEAHGIDSVRWVKIGNRVAGVLSPTVLIRPLPDFVPSDMALWRQDRHGPPRPDEEAHLANLAAVKLEETGEAYARRLAAVLRREFPNRRPAREPATDVIEIAILARLEWPQEDHPLKLLRCHILIRREGIEGRVFVPRCSTCNELLTGASADAAVTVTGNQVLLLCKKPGCPAPENLIPLADFSIWMRQPKAVLWERETRYASASPLAPTPVIEGQVVRYEWNPGHVGGEMHRRFLALQFPRGIEVARISGVFYERLLALGDDGSAKGLPIRLQWFGALANPGDVRTEASPDAGHIDFRNIRIHGWPAAIDKTYAPLSIERRPGVSVGIFPDPSRVWTEWKHYRGLIAGSDRKSLRIAAMNGQSILPWVNEIASGPPAAIGVVSSEEAAAGISFLVPTLGAEPLEGSNLTLAVDFGTTNTLMYASYTGDTSEPNPERHAIDPGTIHSCMLWFARNMEAAESAESLGDVIPGPQRSTARNDRFIFPSEVWLLPENRTIIRWNTEMPLPGARPVGQFKWDPAGTSQNQALRKTYLIHLLLLGLASKAVSSPNRTKPLGLDISFCFPLAFSDSERTRFGALLNDVRDDLMRLTGVTVTNVYSINESMACVRAFGKHRDGETFLIADAGGATIDLAFFTTRDPEQEPKGRDLHQIGSVQFAGEAFIRGLARRKSGSADELGGREWELRDDIASGKAAERYANDPDSTAVLKRFTTSAFELLRIMIGAWRASVHQPSPVNVVLVGNGWNLGTIFHPGAHGVDPVRAFQQYYEHLLALLGLSEVRLFVTDPLDRLQSSKHLAVIGAMKNARTDKRNELKEVAEFPKLPAGRAISLRERRLEWHDLVGRGVILKQLDPRDLSPGSIRVHSALPALEDAWRRQLLSAFGRRSVEELPLPTEPQMREQLQQGLNEHPPQIARGPVQIILEHCWNEELGK